MTITRSEQERHPRAELETIVASLGVRELMRLVISGRLLIDESRMKLTAGDRERHARAELDTIAGSLPVDELTHLVAVGRMLIDETKSETAPDPRRVR